MAKDRYKEEHKEESSVKVNFESWLIDEFYYDVDGKTYTVTQGGTEVPANEADELIKASRKTTAPLQRV